MGKESVPALGSRGTLFGCLLITIDSLYYPFTFVFWKEVPPVKLERNSLPWKLHGH